MTSSSFPDYSPRNYLLAAVGWSVLVAASLYFNLARVSEETIQIAAAAAHANITKDISFRRWGTLHGGVYVPPTSHTPPNPYLKQAGRDVVTDSGKELTLMNPAYMLRQMQEDFSEEYGIRSRITSLKPINPDNAPDAWEIRALRSFESGSTKIMEVQKLDGEPYLRLMLPFVVEEACLKCHGDQGYSIGDIRGGIGTAVPMAQHYVFQEASVKDLRLTHGAIWLIGLLGLGSFSSRSKRLSVERGKAQQALIESELQYRALADSGLALIWTAGLDKGCDFFNKVWLDFTGRSLAQELGHGWAEGVHPDDFQRCLDIYVTAFDQRKSFCMEYRLRHHDGEYRWIYDMGTPRYSAQGDFIGYIGHCMDISDRKQGEREIQRFATIFNNAGWGMVIVDAQTNLVTHANAAYAAMHRIPLADMIGRNAIDSFAPCVRGRIPEYARETLEKGHAVFESMLLRNDDALFPVLIDVTAFKDPRGETLFWAATVEDITERKKIEGALHLWAEAFEHAKFCLAIVDISAGTFISVNPAFARERGYHADELIGTVLLDMIPEDFRKSLTQFVASVLETSHGTFETEHVCKDGRRFPVMMDVTVVRSHDGSPVNAVVYALNLTDRKAAEAKIRKYQAHLEDIVGERTRELSLAKTAAEAATLAKSAFLSNMSHEIRTPMNAIMGMLYLLQRSHLTSEQAERLGKIEVASKHLLEIINAVLDLSKIEAGKFALEETRVNLGGIMANVGSMLYERAYAKGLELQVESQPLPPNLLGDPTRLQQAILNYANNAIKFTRTGRVILRSSMVEEGLQHVMVKVEVEDTGVGIPAEKIGKLFAAFEQADNSIGREYGGTGLGLAITKHLSRLMGGQAGVQSRPGVGSTFWFTARLRKDVTALKTDASTTIGSDIMALKREFSDCRILLVEDEPFNREVALELLSDVWSRIDIAEDGLKAIDLVKRNDYELILMDMRMPRMDGIEATRQIRKMPEGDRIIILAMTAIAFAEDKTRCLDAGMDDFITKPVNPDTLFTTLLNWLRQGK